MYDFMLLGTETYYPANIYLIKVNNTNTRKRCEICSKLATKTSERRQLQMDLTLFSSVSIAVFEQVNVSWVRTLLNVYNGSFCKNS